MSTEHLAPGYGGPWECAGGHQGYTPPALGIPVRCLVGRCDQPVRRVGPGSTEANRKLEELTS